jgi:hypothetical protein
LLLSLGLAEYVADFPRLVRRAQGKRRELFRPAESEDQRCLTEKKKGSKRRGRGPTVRMFERGRSTADERMKVERERARFGSTPRTPEEALLGVTAA